MNFLTLWILTGIILLIAEMITGTFVLVFIALGCFSAALSNALAVDSLSAQIMICAAVSLIGTLYLRKPLQKRLLKNTHLEIDLGKELVCDKDLSVGEQTRLSYQGTTWDAKNIGPEEIKKNQRASIVGVDGNILQIRKI